MYKVTHGGSMILTQLYPSLCDPMDCSQPMEFSRQEYWSGQPFPSPGDLLDPGIEPRSSALQADTLTSEPPAATVAAAAAKSLQSCLTLYDPIDGSPSGFLVPGILQARTLEWVAISLSNA